MGSTVYVATDKGVLTSQNGERWRVIANEMGGGMFHISLEERY